MKFYNYYTRFAKKHKANEEEILYCFIKQYPLLVLQGFEPMLKSLEKAWECMANSLGTSTRRRSPRRDS